MEKLKLKLSQLLFGWYYKKCGDFFAKLPFKKSVNLLLQNYKHQTLLYNKEQKHLKDLIIDRDKIKKELFDIKMKQIATDGQIDWINKGFGMDIHKDNEN